MNCMRFQFQRSAVALVSLLMLVACSFPATSSSTRALPINPGRRVDLVVDQVRNPAGVNIGLYQAVQTIWSGNEVLRSYFTLVDRVSDPSNTVLMVVGIEFEEDGLDRIAIVTVTFLDPVSGIFLASESASATAIGRTRKHTESELLAVARDALELAFVEATRVFSGN